MEKIEFNEIEIILTQLIVDKGIDEISKKTLEERGIEETYANIEGDISYVLNHIITPRFTEVEMRYIISAADEVHNPALRARYSAVLVESSDKKQKYEYSKSLIEYVLLNKDQIFNNSKWNIFI